MFKKIVSTNKAEEVKRYEIDNFSELIALSQEIKKENANNIHIHIGDVIKKIPHNFLRDCVTINELVITGAKNVVVIENNFLMNCISLKKIDITSMQNVETIQSSFLEHCIELKSIDLRNFKNLKFILMAFMLGCKRLESLDISSFQNVNEIGNGFLLGTKSLQSIDNCPSSLRNYFIRTHLVKLLDNYKG